MKPHPCCEPRSLSTPTNNSSLSKQSVRKLYIASVIGLIWRVKNVFQLYWHVVVSKRMDSHVTPGSYNLIVQKSGMAPAVLAILAPLALQPRQNNNNLVFFTVQHRCKHLSCLFFLLL